jgi:hypothetical protein
MSAKPSLFQFVCPRCKRFIAETSANASVFCPDCAIWFDSKGNTVRCGKKKPSAKPITRPSEPVILT